MIAILGALNLVLALAVCVLALRGMRLEGQLADARWRLSVKRKSWVEDIGDFHQMVGQHEEALPGFGSDELVALRHELIEEEVVRELLPAIRARHLSKTADGIVDGIVVLIGSARCFGLPLEALWREVHRANMDKRGGPRRADGKILKPPGWTPPDIDGVLERHRVQRLVAERRSR